ncbi:hypothetical protein Cri9333_3656 [Crinalium epipsammum PCC 9333]|uniref:Uncharacterized protein n=1 Tax=Crinalium epipsammum PCC 9333 TaxID=1173022 RepID=K9W2L7_9CYAN|nr:hypothetical protein [Crinalium epipsammum]AFZ14471.1 hypothetical protein Cri9333_3656 [Crinalium epipsammum PCC 9333]
MARSHLLKICGAGLVVATLSILPLARPAAADTSGMTQYQKGRHEMGGYGSNVQVGNMMQAQGMNSGMQSNMMSVQDMNNRWYSASEMYRMGRHEWSGSGMMTGLRTYDNGSMMMQRQSTGSDIIINTTTPSQNNTTTPGMNMNTTTPGGTMQR